MPSTGYAELDGLLAELVERSRTTFGDAYVGSYLVGSFAVGDPDLHSDCDFLVVVRSAITPGQETRVRAFHDEIPTRAGHWTQHLEGSYAHRDDLADLNTFGRPWLFIDHGHREMEWSDHCNTQVVRWSLYEHGVTLDGPEPRSFVAEVPAELVRAQMRTALPTLTEDILSWASPELAWTQRYLVTTYCRVLYSLTTGRVISKRAALLWGEQHLNPRWVHLLRTTREDRERGWDPADPPRPGSLEESYAFGTWCRNYARTLAS